MCSFENGSHPYYCLFISLMCRVCLFKSGAKSKGQVVTGLAGTALGASCHLMWGRQRGMGTLKMFKVETTVLFEIPQGFPDSPSKKHCTYSMASHWVTKYCLGDTSHLKASD